MDVVATWNAVLEKEARQGLSSLSPRERTIYFVNRFICDFANGGVSGFLYNLSADWASLLAFEEEIRRVGCEDIAKSLGEVRAVLLPAERLPPKQETWAQFLARADPMNRLIEIDSRLDGVDGVLWEALEAFTKGEE